MEKNCLIFDEAVSFDVLDSSDTELKAFLNYNPIHREYTKRQNIPERSVEETDRGGWRGYDRVYSKYFKNIRNDKLKILEIGIHAGYGIYAWQNYFRNSMIYGIDINWNTDMIQHRNDLKIKHPLFKKAKLYNIDSTDKNHWIEFYGKQFDIIIDDGGHHPKTQVATFDCGWKYLKSKGLYFIEDVGHRYGEEELNFLSDKIESHKREFDEINIYYHENVGLKYVLQNKFYVKKNNIKNKNVSNIEYIIAIRKK